jgi:agmatinase
MRGAAEGPRHIRAALASESANWSTESGRDLQAEPRFVDAGDVSLRPGTRALEDIEEHAAAIVSAGGALLALGGDHALTWPLVKAQYRLHGPISILHIDAHPDLYDEFQGSRYSHACPFARIMEAGLAARLIQVGIRTMTPAQRAQATRFGVEVVEMRRWRPDLEIEIPGDVYVSLDLDALDPGCAPGVAHHEPGGLLTRDVIGLLQRFKGRLVAADIVELNPTRDPLGITSMVAAKLVKELADRLLTDVPAHPVRLQH